MMQQTLGWTPTERAEIESTRPPTIQERWEQFHYENPHVYRAIVREALAIYAKGYRRWGFELIWNDLRWRHQCKTTGKPWALCNDFKKPCVEKLVAEYPQLDSMFVRRKSRQQEGN